MTVTGNTAPTYETNPGGTYQGRYVPAEEQFGARVYYPEITYARIDDRLANASLNPRPGGLIDAVNQPPAPVATAHELRLAITTPANVRLGADLPVVVFIHGGGYEWGKRDEPWFDGAGFAKDNIITVSVSYRLGIDGFLPFHDDEPAHYRGINDCNTALDWVQKNIEDFGGDPTNVTLMGQSAGAGICLWLMRRDHYRGTFRRVWAMSPGFPRVNFSRRKWLLRAVAGPITRARFSALGVDGRAKAFKKYRRFVATDLPLGPSPYAPDELADVDLIISYTGQEFHRQAIARRLDKAWYSRPLRPLFAHHLGARLNYATNSGHYFGQLISDSLFTQQVVRTTGARPSAWVLAYEGTDDQPALHCCDLPLVFGNHPLIAHTPWDLLPEVTDDFLAQCHKRAVDYARGITPSWPAFGARGTVLAVDINAHETTLREDPFTATRAYFVKN